jgi:hypothetical protein
MSYIVAILAFVCESWDDRVQCILLVIVPRCDTVYDTDIFMTTYTGNMLCTS